jgi:hypothetical protein
MFSLPCSSHHTLPRGLHAPVRGSHMLARACYALSCSSRATARSSSANLLPPYPLLQLLLSGLFIVNFMYFYTFSFILQFVFLFVGFYLPIMMWFDLEKEIDVGGCLSAPL